MPKVDVVLPVYNEAHVLERSVRSLHAFLQDNLAHEWRILIADNGSKDGTFEVAKHLEQELGQVFVMHIPEPGRGRALTKAWLSSDADVLSYMDIDLSTGLESFPRLVSEVAEHGYDVAAGSRLSKNSDTTRSLKREVLSRTFVAAINLMFRTKLADTQCGFKAISRAAAQKLLPLIEDTGWFWDTELLLMASKGGWKMVFVPVRWVEDTDSRVHIASTVTRDLKGLWRMKRFDWERARKGG
ncbi:MAG TPA: glycosyltransferase [Dehalococcoidia bacterium]|jgi:glycosyltransferase involved in cell wall biosynthesis|nr:glycosyltransferase [Dehalococcoidia bacterium]